MASHVSSDMTRLFTQTTTCRSPDSLDNAIVVWPIAKPRCPQAEPHGDGACPMSDETFSIPRPYASLSSQSEGTVVSSSARRSGVRSSPPSSACRKRHVASRRDHLARAPAEQLDVGHVVERLGGIRENWIPRLEIGACETRAVPQIGSLEAQRLGDPSLQLLAQRRARRLLDDQPEREVVAARVLPACSGWKETRPGVHELERRAGS